MTTYIRSGGALWPLDRWWASRVVALAVPNCQARARVELVAVAWLLAQVADDAAEVAA